MIKLSGSIARKRKNVERRREAAVPRGCLVVPKADSGASKPAIIATKSWDWQARMVFARSRRQDHAGITRGRPRLAEPGLWKPGAMKDQTPLQILTIRQMLQRVAFIMPTV